MKKRELGTNGMLVSEIGLGCMSLPKNRQEVDEVVATALDSGITFFDTADLYENGTNEELVGHAIKNHRKDIILATKVGNEMNPDGKTWHWNASKQQITEGVKASLKRLGTDYIDLYQLHGGTMEDNVDEVIEAFDLLKREGVIREYGISSIRPNVIQRFLSKSAAVSVMMQYNMLDRRPEEWFPLVDSNGASIVVRGTLAKGLLTDEGLKRVDKMDSFEATEQPELGEIIKNLTSSSSNLHAAAIQFTLRSERIATTLVGARTQEQLKDSLKAYELGYEGLQLDKLIKLLPLHYYEQHRI